MLGTVANLFPRKGYEVMLRALPAIVRAVPRVHYVIVGSDENNYGDGLAQLAQELKIADRVPIVGSQDPVQPFLAPFDLAYASGTHGGVGDCGGRSDGHGKGRGRDHDRVGLPEVVEGGGTGLLVSPDNPDSIAAAWQDFLVILRGDPQMGRAGCQHVLEQFGPSSSVEAF